MHLSQLGAVTGTASATDKSLSGLYGGWHLEWNSLIACMAPLGLSLARRGAEWLYCVCIPGRSGAFTCERLFACLLYR